jgi:tetratricopeptide (TPR) repeat protein
LLQAAGRLDEAESCLTRGRDACQAVPSSSPADPRLKQELMAILGHLGLVLRERGRLSEAMAIYADAVRMQRSRLAASPDSSAERELLVVLLGSQANAMTAAGQADAAERIRFELRDLALRLKDDYPAIPRYRQRAAANLSNLATGIGHDSARMAEARALFDQAISLQEGLVAMSPNVPDHLSKLAQMCDALANLLRIRGKLDEAEPIYRKELDYQKRLAREHPQVTDYRFGQGQVLNNLADLLRERGRLEEALPLSREAIQELGGLYRSNPRNTFFRQGYSYTCWTLAQILVDRRDHRAAAEVVAEYLRIEPNDFEESFESTGFLCHCAKLVRDDASVPEEQRENLARAYAGRAMDALAVAVRNGFRDPRRLQTVDTYEPLRDREDFRRLMAELWDRVFPADPFAP